ncbi:elicitin [Phytophthora sojae]|uniref:Elicitin n=2 Tax=Phytophthora sojae TaxID=67593 RepID=G5A2R7_PHYSP|nr:elicitin [Phytophthora sojae]AAO24645.1 elicitin protein [Phytophthora sojae]ABB56025.1 elicitin-like protein SOL3A [Phytophthora sojae]EGZ09957.1 elicitin [Phytophthora sojae]|eukprot:XP_009534818.1 elicitin [Phytophthora sojae]
MPSFTSIVLLGLAMASPVRAADCPTEALLGLASNTNLATCQTETGVSVATISTLTDSHISTICTSTACLGLMADVAAMDLGDCTIPGSSVTVQTDVLDRVAAACGSSASSTSTGSTDAGSSGSMRSSGAANVGDDSGSNSDKVVGGSTTGSSSATTVTAGFVSTFVLAAGAMLL